MFTCGSKAHAAGSILAIAATLGCASTSAAQQDSIPWPRADQMIIRVSASIAEVNGDTIRAGYTLHNGAASAQSAETLVIRTDIAPLSLRRPSRIGWIATQGEIQDSTGIAWFGAGTAARVAPGDSLSGFEYTAAGIVAVVGYYVKGVVPSPVYDDSLPDLIKRPPPLWSNSIHGVTVGIIQPPAMESPMTMSQRLEAITDQACTLGWISELGICTSLEAKQRVARRALERGDLPVACNNVNSFINEVSALAANKISPEGRSLLIVNARRFIAKYCS
jgi:hypothetical protein